MPLSAARNFSPECALASSIARRVSLVNLQKFTFATCDEPRSIMMFAPAQKMRSLSDDDDDRVDLGMLEAQALDGVGELDVDAEIVGVELQLVVRRQARVLAHVHRERGDRAVEGQLPVLVVVRVGIKGDH